MDIQILKDGQDMGTYPVEQVNQHLEGGMFEATDLGWHEGMTDWAQLSEIAGVVLPGTAGEEAPSAEEVAQAEASLVTIKASDSGGWLGLIKRNKVLVGGLSGALVLGAGAYYVFGGEGDLAALCQVQAKLHPVIKAPPKKAVKETPPIEKYPASATKTSFDDINKNLDLRGDYYANHAVRNARGIAQAGLSAFAAALPRQTGEDALASLVAMAQTTVQATNGVEEISGYGSSSFCVAEGYFRNTSILYRPTNSVGRLWQVVDANATGDLACLRVMPPSTVLAIVGRVNLHELTSWTGELIQANPSAPWATALTKLKTDWEGKLPLQKLAASWSGEAALFVTMEDATQNISTLAGGTVSINRPGFLLAMKLNNEDLTKWLMKHLEGLKPGFEEFKTGNKGRVTVNLRTYPSLTLSPSLKGINMAPVLLSHGNRLIIASNDSLAKSTASVLAINGAITPSKEFSTLKAGGPQNTRALSLKSDLIWFMSGRFGQNLAKYRQTDFWKTLDPAIAGVLDGVASASPHGSALGEVRGVENGLIHDCRVKAANSDQARQITQEFSLQAVKAFLPRLAALVQQHVATIKAPAATPPTPAPNTGAPKTTETEPNTPKQP